MSEQILTRDEYEKIPFPKNVQEYYYHRFYCTNCQRRNENDRWIFKGITAKDKTIKCDNCGCTVGG